VDQQAVAVKHNNNNKSPQTAENNGKSARALRRRRRRNKKQQNSQQPDCFEDPKSNNEQLTPSTSNFHCKEEDSITDSNKMPARFADDVITAEPDTRTAPQLDLGGGHYASRQQQQHLLNDEIAITGFSGRLPESSSIEEFKQNLFDGIDMVNDEPRRWERGESFIIYFNFSCNLLLICTMKHRYIYDYTRQQPNS